MLMLSEPGPFSRFMLVSEDTKGCGPIRMSASIGIARRDRDAHHHGLKQPATKRCERRRGPNVDFVVAGLGFGALLVVIGFAVRDLGPLIWRPAGNASDDVLQAERLQRTTLCRALSNTLTVAGGVPLIATVVAVA